MKRSFPICLLVLLTVFAPSGAGFAASFPDAARDLVPHKALYNVQLVATHSGSQILNISGQMIYEWKPSCDAWVTDHRFKLNYEYADSPGMKITSDFSTFESADGKNFDFTSRRQRDGDLYQEIRGRADNDIDAKKHGGKAFYSLPENLTYDLTPGTLFPMGHTLALLDSAKAGKKFFSASVFDGSDEDGPIEINAFIGKKVDPLAAITDFKNIDKDLLKGPAWNVRMAVFPLSNQEESSDYEMSLVFSENGIISDMLIEYDDFSVTQKLVALEKIPAQGCGAKAGTKKAEPPKKLPKP